MTHHRRAQWPPATLIQPLAPRRPASGARATGASGPGPSRPGASRPGFGAVLASAVAGDGLSGATGRQLAHIAGLPASSLDALDQAMTREQVPASWRSGLQFIMAQESSGMVDVRNPHHSARGLFQLTAANYRLNPHGAASFGNAVEEAQGGIRYVESRYGTAQNAVAFWQTHHWY